MTCPAMTIMVDDVDSSARGGVDGVRRRLVRGSLAVRLPLGCPCPARDVLRAGAHALRDAPPSYPPDRRGSGER